MPINGYTIGLALVLILFLCLRFARRKKTAAPELESTGHQTYIPAAAATPEPGLSGEGNESVPGADACEPPVNPTRAQYINPQPPSDGYSYHYTPETEAIPEPTPLPAANPTPEPARKSKKRNRKKHG